MADGHSNNNHVPVLLSFSAFSRPSSVPVGSGYEVLIQKFLSLYGRQIDLHRKFMIQLYSDEWAQYIDLPKGFIISEKCKLRFVPLETDVTILGNLIPATTVFFCCDMQERFRPAIKYFGDIISVGQRLTVLHVLIGQQRVKSQYCTIRMYALNNQRYVLISSHFVIRTLNIALPRSNPDLLCCLSQTHVCIQQTALDLLARGFEVHIVADSTSSRSMMDRMFALERMARTGIIVTTSESILLQLVGDKEHPKFKEIQNIIKASAPESGLLSKV
uniref:Isochorismatase domain-containing protein 1 n=1 Tax=Salmo trutta TaxID=8032 RepID=A0A674APE1_SALTR